MSSKGFGAKNVENASLVCQPKSIDLYLLNISQGDFFRGFKETSCTHSSYLYQAKNRNSQYIL